MGNIMCCRRETYAPNATDSNPSRCGQRQQSASQQSGHQKHPSKQSQHQMSSAYHSAGDDCAINELLEGRMDLDVLMPDGRQVRLTVERRTPMMDLLVQAASATKISPGGHVIHVFGDGDKGSTNLQYKPSTPIGSLDTNTICIVPKKESADPLARRMGKTANRPFEPTFRVQVHLPRNQLTFLRVSPRIKIADLKSMVCNEKGLDTGRYQLVRPSGPTQPLSGDMTLAEYGSTEITLLSNSSIESNICNSTSHIIPYSNKRAEDAKRRNGILRLLTEDAINNKANETTNCNSTYRAEEKANKPEEAHAQQHRFKPKKRRPAPPPPPPVLPDAPYHSRQSSSDSSGYHEATSSFLHEEHSGEEKASSDSSGVSSFDGKVPAEQPSTPPPVPNSKKKKAPAPPPPSRLKEKPVHHKQAPACPLKKFQSLGQSVDSKNLSMESVDKAVVFRNHSMESIGRSIDSKIHSMEFIGRSIDSKNQSMESIGSSIDSKNQSTESIGSSIDSKNQSTESIGSSIDSKNQSTESIGSSLDSKNQSTESIGTSIDSIGQFIDSKNQSTESVGMSNESIVQFIDSKNRSTECILDRLLVDKDLPSETPATKTGLTVGHTHNHAISQEDSSKNALVAVSSQNGDRHTRTVERKAFSRKGPAPLSTAGFTISTYSETRSASDSTIRVISGDNLEDNPDQGRNSDIVEDRMLTEDRVPNWANAGKETSDLPNPHSLWENKGRRLDRTQLTVAPKDLPAAQVSTSTDPVKGKEIGQELESKKETTSLVFEGYKQRSPDKKNPEDSSLTSKGEAVSTRVALVALNARIEQDVTQQEIASSIEAAFHSVDFSPQPSLLAIKQRNAEDSIVRLEEDPSAPQTISNPENKTDFSTSNRQREALGTDEVPVSPKRTPSKSLKRSSSLLSFPNTTTLKNGPLANPRHSHHLQRSLTDLSIDGREDFEAEQQRLQREYIKLQRQFIVWQQQLMNNHAMLREECIVPQYARTLRQSHSLPEGEDSFDETTPSAPLVSRSLSYEPTKDRCSTLPRSAINITSLEFGSIPLLTNGTSTLRSSKTKSYFKPPQVRASTKSRQRLPPEIKREGDVDITDDTKMLTTILPSFESLKLITENHDDDHQLDSSRLKEGNPTRTASSEVIGRRVPVVHLSSTLPKIGSFRSYRDVKCVNGDTGQSSFRVDCSQKTGTVNGQSPKPQPPPPPPMPVNGGGATKCPVVENCSSKSTGQKNGVGKKDLAVQADSRDQLMLEIRKFGGRTALRKISLAS